MEVLDYIYGSSEIMNLLNWGEQDKDYVIEDADNGIINFPEGITSDNAGYNLNLGWELPNQLLLINGLAQITIMGKNGRI